LEGVNKPVEGRCDVGKRDKYLWEDWRRAMENKYDYFKVQSSNTAFSREPHV
jgi:hypothetical protein